MKIVICKQCKKTTIRYGHCGTIFCNRKCYFDWKKNNPNKRAYKGRVLIGGYYYLYKPGYPNAIKNDRYIAEHRYMIEKSTGRTLLQNEDVHHINGIKTDNRPENLQVLTKSKHSKISALKKSRDQNGKFKKNHQVSSLG